MNPEVIKTVLVKNISEIPSEIQTVRMQVQFCLVGLVWIQTVCKCYQQTQGVKWLTGRVLDSRPRGRGVEPHRCHCVVSLSNNINPSLVLVQPRKTCPFITERLFMGRKESNQTNKQNYQLTPLAGKVVIELGTFFSYRRNINLIQVTSRIKQSQQREESQ